MSDEKSVEKFYNEFDFERIITGDPPKPIQEFLEGEIDFIKKQILPGKKILEIGCGYGRLMEILSENAEKVVGIDYSKRLLEEAKKRLSRKENTKVFLMNAKNLEFNDESFDYVVCLDNSFGNMPGIESQVLKEMIRTCKSGGEIIVSVFSENAVETQIENYKRIGLKEIRDDGKAIHTKEGLYSRRFTKEDLKNLFKEAGLEEPKIIKICSVNYIAIARKH